MRHRDKVCERTEAPARMAIRRFPRLPNCKRCIGPRMGGDLGLCWLARFQLLRGTHLDGQADCVQHGAGDRQEQHVHVHHPALLARYNCQLRQVQARPCACMSRVQQRFCLGARHKWPLLVFANVQQWPWLRRQASIVPHAGTEVVSVEPTRLVASAQAQYLARQQAIRVLRC